MKPKAIKAKPKKGRTATEEEGRSDLERSGGRKPREENGISNRRFYSNFIPPLTKSAEKCGKVQKK
jgi:hypothetical protein